MLDTNVESLLQEIATEMAFLSPGRSQGLDQVVLALQHLSREPSTQAQANVQQELAWSLSLCEQALGDSGLEQQHIDGLQASFERLTGALYTAPAPAAPVTVLPPDDPLTEIDHEISGFSIAANDDLELLNEFCNEGRDLLTQVEQSVLILEENPRHKDTLNQVFRAFHTFKGGAGFLGIEPIKNLAHQLESLLDAARRDELIITRTVIELILAGGDALQRYVDAIAKQLAGEGRGQRIVVPTAALLERVQACLAGEAPPASAVSEQQTTSPTPKKDSGSPALTEALNDLIQGAQTLTERREPIVSAPAPSPVVIGPASAPTASPAAAPNQERAPANSQAPAKIAARADNLASYVKLDTRKLDALVDLMGELVIAQSMVVQHPLVQRQDDRELERHLRQLSRITTDLQHNAMSLRMVPIRSAFQKMTRLVRDLATSQNKQVQLHLSGEDTELDRNIVEELADPLLHMMRNAVDHGIEAPSDRVEQGKTAQGNIYLHAAHQGGGILIRMRDDGKGLNSQKILDKALQRGLISADSAPSEKDIYNLIFLPGFSTADTVTDISGRGVGMDVVRGSINRLRGRIDIDSVPGEGTTFNIFLPLTLAIIDGMLVGVGSERFILPTLAIRESLRPQPGMVFTVQGKGEVISVRSKLIPLVRLSEKLGIQGTTNDPCEGIVMVVDSGARTRALLVDSLIGKQEVVIKSLGETFKHHKGMSGAAIMGDGRVALIIDPDAVSQLPSVMSLAA
jgi:two-component system chemotaxis sensor kinase CheA